MKVVAAAVMKEAAAAAKTRARAATSAIARAAGRLLLIAVVPLPLPRPVAMPLPVMMPLPLPRRGARAPWCRRAAGGGPSPAGAAWPFGGAALLRPPWRHLRQLPQPALPTPAAGQQLPRRISRQRPSPPPRRKGRLGQPWPRRLRPQRRPNPECRPKPHQQARCRPKPHQQARCRPKPHQQALQQLPLPRALAAPGQQPAGQLQQQGRQWFPPGARRTILLRAVFIPPKRGRTAGTQTPIRRGTSLAFRPQADQQARPPSDRGLPQAAGEDTSGLRFGGGRPCRSAPAGAALPRSAAG